MLPMHVTLKAGVMLLFTRKSMLVSVWYMLGSGKTKVSVLHVDLIRLPENEL